jgi:hypothetical protein
MRTQLSPGAWVIRRDPEVTPPIDGGVIRGRRADSVLERKNYSVGDWMFHLCARSVEGINLLNHFHGLTGLKGRNEDENGLLGMRACLVEAQGAAAGVC